MDQKPAAFSWGMPAANATYQPQQPAQQATSNFSFNSFGNAQPVAAPAQAGFGAFGAPAAATPFGGFASNLLAQSTVPAAAPLTANPTNTAFSFGSAFGAPAATTQTPALGGSSTFSLFGNTSTPASAVAAAAPAAASSFGAFTGFGGSASSATSASPFASFGSTVSQQPTVAVPSPFAFGQAATTQPSSSNIFGGSSVQPFGTALTSTAATASAFSGFGAVPVATAAAPASFSGFGFGQPAAAPAATSSTNTFGSAPPAFSFGGSQPAYTSAPATTNVPSFAAFGTGPTSSVGGLTPSIFGVPTCAAITTTAAVPATAPVVNTGFSFGSSSVAPPAPTTTAQQPFGFFQQQTTQPTTAAAAEPPKPAVFSMPAATTAAAPSIFGSLPSSTSNAAPPATAPVSSAQSVSGFSFAPNATSTPAPGVPPTAGITQPMTAGLSTPAIAMQTPTATPSINTAAAPNTTPFNFGSTSIVAPSTAGISSTAGAQPAASATGFNFGSTSIAAPSTAAISGTASTQQSVAATGFNFGAVKPASTPVPPATAAATTVAPSTAPAGSSTGFSFQLPTAAAPAATTGQPPATPAPPTNASAVPSSAAVASQQPPTPSPATASVVMPTAAPQAARPAFQFGAPSAAAAAPTFAAPTTSSGPVFNLSGSAPQFKLPLSVALPAAGQPQQQFNIPPVVSAPGGFVVPVAAAPLILPTSTASVKPELPLFSAQLPTSSALTTATAGNVPTVAPAATLAGTPTLVSPSRAARVSFQLPHSGLVVSPGSSKSRGVPTTSGTAAVVLDEQDRERMLKMLRSWTWRDLSEFCDLQARELDSVHTETFHAGHIWLLSLQVLREDMQDKLSALIEASKDDYDQAHRLERELDYIDAELNELEKLVDNGEAIVRERTKNYDDKQQSMLRRPQQQLGGNSPRNVHAYESYENNYYGGANGGAAFMPTNNAPSHQLSDYLHELYGTVYDACASTYDFTQRFEAVRSAFTSTLFPSSFSNNERHWMLEAPHEAQQSSTFSHLILSSIAFAEVFRFDRLHHMLRCLEQIQLEYEHLYKSLNERIQPEVAMRIAANIERRLRIVEERFRVAEKMGSDEMGLAGSLSDKLNIRSSDNSSGRYLLPAAGSGGGLDMLNVASTLFSSPR